MHQATRRPCRVDGALLQRFLGDILVDGAGDFAVLPEGMDLAGMGAGPDLGGPFSSVTSSTSSAVIRSSLVCRVKKS